MIFFKLLKFYRSSKDKRRLPVLYCSPTFPLLSFHAVTCLIILLEVLPFLTPKFNTCDSTNSSPPFIYFLYVHLNITFQSTPTFYMKPFFGFLSKFYVYFPFVLQDYCNIFGERHSHESFNYAVFSSRPFLASSLAQTRFHNSILEHP